MLRRLTVSAPLLSFALSVGCASGPPPAPPPPPPVDLTPEEVASYVRAKAYRLKVCYTGEAISHTGELSSFIFQLDIPPDGTGHDVTLVSETQPQQGVLRTCIMDVLRKIRFPKFDHETLSIEVPIRPGI